MKLTCPNNPEHKTFHATAQIHEIWLLNEDGDCEDAWEGGPVTGPDLSEATCEECHAAVVLKEE